MSVIEKLLEETAVPNMLRVRQVFDDTHIDPEQIPQTVVEQLSQEKIPGPFGRACALRSPWGAEALPILP